MRYYHRLISIFLLLFLLLTAIAACANRGSGGGRPQTTTVDPFDWNDDFTAGTEPPDTLVIEIVPSPSLSGVDEIENVGVVVGDVILSAEGCFGGGAIFGGVNQHGSRLWEAAAAEEWPVLPGRSVPESFPTVIVNAGDTLEIVNHTEGTVTDVTYIHYRTGKDVGQTLPTARDAYICKITVELERPGSVGPLPELGAKFGEWNYFVVVSVESDIAVTEEDANVGGEATEDPAGETDLGDEGIETFEEDDDEENVTLDFDDETMMGDNAE